MPKRLTRVFCAALPVILIVFLFSSCFSGGRRSYKTASPGEASAAQSSASFRSSDIGSTGKKIGTPEDGVVFHPATTNIGLSDPENGFIWSALPSFSTLEAAVLNVTVFGENGAYLLDSQANSVAFSSFEILEDDGALTVVYTMAENAPMAAKSPEETVPGDIYVRVPVRYAAVGGCLTVSIDMAAVFAAEGLVIESLDVLPFFGAVDYSQTRTADQKNDFILVPDGCGAKIGIGASVPCYADCAFTVYGSADDKTRKACLGVFGEKHGASAFVCVLTEGEANAVIRSVTPGNKGGINRVFASFAVTEISDDGTNRTYGETYDGRLTLCYRCLSGSGATCEGMAAAAREMLIRAGKLSGEAIGEASLPVLFEITGSAAGNRAGVQSDYEQIEDFLGIIKAKGFDNSDIVLKGFLTGGEKQKVLTSASLVRANGSRDELRSLCDFAVKQGCDLFLAGHIVGAGYGPADKLTDLTGGRVKFPVSDVFSDKAFSFTKTGAKQMKESAVRLLDIAEKNGIAGVALTDINGFLSSDSGSDFDTRQKMADLLSSEAASCAVLKKLMVGGCSFNTLRYAGHVTSIPYRTALAEDTGYEAAPFIQMILHSSLIYSGTPCNLTAVPRLELLKTIEYGGALSFSVTTKPGSALYYETVLEEHSELALKAVQELSDLAGRRMVSHEKVEEGVTCTGFEGGTLVYVNYNNFSVNIGDIAVLPYDFMRVN